jgi:predicted phosphoribosyltransferase
MYADRIEAGLVLADQLKKYAGHPGVVLVVPRGGVPLGYIIARELKMPMEILLSKKIGHPNNPEYAIGAVSLTDRIIIHHEGVSNEYIESETEKIREKLKENYKKFMGNNKPNDLKNKIVIIVDDGIATGNTLLSAVKILRQKNPAKIVIAAPVASRSSVEKLSKFVDEMVIPLIPKEFYGVGGFYEDFEQVSDEEVLSYLDKLGKNPANHYNE